MLSTKVDLGKGSFVQRCFSVHLREAKGGAKVEGLAGVSLVTEFI